MILYSTFWLMFTFTVPNNHHIGLVFTLVQLFKKKTLTNIDSMHEEIRSNLVQDAFRPLPSITISSRMIRFEDVLLNPISN